MNSGIKKAPSGLIHRTGQRRNINHNVPADSIALPRGKGNGKYAEGKFGA